MATADGKRDQEQKSSAVSLSDMEVFIFPELMYALVLANIMSPRIWRWREDPWFDGVERMKPYRRITRLKQYIMQRYIFNLDLDTWGLTTKEAELARFCDFIDEETLARSNALFGYEGDRYYFDIDIRKHFGLDKYSGNVIPYWKTETVEAMDAFRHKPGYETGAGECVSLATLYAAALFIVARIPLEDIYLMATPLHSQNFIDVDDGILTNNRRLVTKRMWFNGTALSAQARRALENERVTLVAHATGYVHTLYEQATIDPDVYEAFGGKLKAYLNTPLSGELVGNFLRQHRDFQRCFQLRFTRHGRDHFAAMERLFAYEHGSPFLITDQTRDKLIADMEGEELMHDPLPDRIVFNNVEDFVHKRRLDLGREADVDELKKQFCHDCLDAEAVLEKLIRFCSTDPRLPDASRKTFVPSGETPGMDATMSREQVMKRIEELRGKMPAADLAFYAYRDVNRTDALPFLKAAWDRNPVCVEGCARMNDAQVVEHVSGLASESIYDEAGRLAQPDEVWNFGRGDGAEKAILLVNVLLRRHPETRYEIRIAGDRAEVRGGGFEAAFPSAKGLREAVWRTDSVAQDA